MSNQLMIKEQQDLVNIKNKFNEAIGRYKYRILICSGAGCISSNCHQVKEALIKALEDSKLTEQVMVTETGCIGTCDLGPVMVVMPDGVFYTKLTPADMPAIVYSHLLSGKVKTDNTYFDKISGQHVPYIKDIKYFNDQMKIALRNCGVIDHASLEEYIARDGYMAIAKALTQMSPAEVVEELRSPV